MPTEPPLPTATWMPKTEMERTVYAALILAGEPVNTLKLAALMGVGPGESSRRVAQLEGLIRKARKGSRGSDQLELERSPVIDGGAFVVARSIENQSPSSQETGNSMSGSTQIDDYCTRAPAWSDISASARMTARASQDSRTGDPLLQGVAASLPPLS
jgi:hypothetical protein